jgi:hypothetical protein
MFPAELRLVAVGASSESKTVYKEVVSMRNEIRACIGQQIGGFA